MKSDMEARDFAYTVNFSMFKLFNLLHTHYNDIYSIFFITKVRYGNSIKHIPC